jgi:hypothetical protein
MNLILQKDVSSLGDLGIATVELENVVRPKHSQALRRKARVVPQELLDQAMQNNPLEMIPRWEFSDELKASSSFRSALPELRESFLNTHFLMFADLGITFETEGSQVTNLIAEKTAQNEKLGAYYAACHTSFTAFQKIFSFVDFITEKGRFEEKHLTSVYTICTAYAAISDVVRAAKLMKPIGMQVAFNRERYIFEIPTVLPTSNLPEVFLAMPVCFFGDLSQSEIKDDPKPSARAKMICDAVGSKSFAWFYQMYNRRDRSIKDFPNIDPIPSDYVEFRQQLNGLVDLEVITTPYHQIAAREWADPAWLASIDPIAIAMHHDIPFFTIMKRWSGNGIFPLLCNLMANTIDHVKGKKSALSNFRGDTYWYKGDSEHGGSSTLGNNGLSQFAEQLIQSFSQGKVFDFLGG